jgi:hypothetical protein
MGASARVYLDGQIIALRFHILGQHDEQFYIG